MKMTDEQYEHIKKCFAIVIVMQSVLFGLTLLAIKVTHG